jgi:hypothetical protein
VDGPVIVADGNDPVQAFRKTTAATKPNTPNGADRIICLSPLFTAEHIEDAQSSHGRKEIISDSIAEQESLTSIPIPPCC